MEELAPQGLLVEKTKVSHRQKPKENLVIVHQDELDYTPSVRKIANE